ncbi:ribonuclease III domain-containing protein [Russula ochroleuca]|uniref:Ribonuclease III domain-containing protein n=1 Tax=Russula ochroleuca TaxID=152965 RepID=A0A9P5JXL2_9AGAM|nr:ribonuclease III domain-containing protein [Russula ochroleuca]
MSPSANNTPSGLPSLPMISSELIQEQIFTHRSLFRRPKRAFEDSPSNANLDNELLINIGDQVFSLVVTDLIQDSFPNLCVGPSSKVRDRLKFHGKLAKTAVQYGLHERLRVQAAQADEVKRSVHAQAEVFKAYVGGLYREQGLDVVRNWLCTLFQWDIREAYEIVRREHLL